jgi:hypothetical protein
VKTLKTVVKNKQFMLVWLFSLAWDAVKLACQKAVFICPLATDEQQRSCVRMNA